MTTGAIFGTAVGIALGFALIFDGFGPMLIVALFGAIGLIVAKVVAGEMNLGDYTQRRDDRYPQGRRGAR